MGSWEEVGEETLGEKRGGRNPGKFGRDKRGKKVLRWGGGRWEAAS